MVTLSRTVVRLSLRLENVKTFVWRSMPRYTRTHANGTGQRVEGAARRGDRGGKKRGDGGDSRGSGVHCPDGSRKRSRQLSAIESGPKHPRGASQRSHPPRRSISGNRQTAGRLLDPPSPEDR